MKDIIRKELSEAQSVLENFFIDDNINKIESAANIFKTTISQGNKIISCGNGGSMCDAMHFAEELTGKFREERKPLPQLLYQILLILRVWVMTMALLIFFLNI